MTPRRPQAAGQPRPPKHKVQAPACPEADGDTTADLGTLFHTLRAAMSDALAAMPPPSPRLAYSIDEAAELLGVGKTAFREYVLPQLRVVKVGTKPIIPRRELEAWLDREAHVSIEVDLAKLRAPRRSKR